ncbi:MAG: hypothetical protein GC201_12645 [Alphaproteobacteria bacterium]|nr:hypothetical protein [Alphaproteobacteria bacterium]
MNRPQIQVAAGVGAGLVLGAGVGWVLWRHLGISPRPFDLAQRLAFALTWSLLPALCLVAGILMVANQRFFAGAGDPLTADDRMAEIWRRYVANTAEQALLFLIGAGAFSVVAPQAELKAVPIAAALFVLGRMLFAGGYLIRPSLRAAGFTLTFAPVALLCLLAALIAWFRF